MNDVLRLEHEAQVLRSKIGNNLETLGKRLSPSRLVQDVKDEGMRTLFGVRDQGLNRLHKVRDGSARVLSDLHDQGTDLVNDVEIFIQDNPVAAGTAAAFAGVLLVYHLRPSTFGGGNRPINRRVTTSFGDGHQEKPGLGVVAEKVATMADNIVDHARTTWQRTRAHAATGTKATSEHIAATLDGVRDTVVDAAARARTSAVSLGHTTGETIQDHTEAAVTLAMITGVLVAVATHDVFRRDGA